MMDAVVVLLAVKPAGPLTVAASGAVAPGASIGTLTVNNNVTLGGTAVMEISKDGGVPASDLLAVSGNLAYGGGPHEWVEFGDGAPLPKSSTPLMRNIAARLAKLLPGAAHANIIRSWAGLIEARIRRLNTLPREEAEAEFRLAAAGNPRALAPR